MGYVKCWTLALAGFDPLTQQMDKAREVQKTLDEAAEKTKTAVDQQERGDPDK